MNESIAIPKHLLSRFLGLSERLELDEKETIEALFDWTEISLFLAEVLDIEELKTNILYEKVQSLILKQQTEVKENKLEKIVLSTENINDLCFSIKLMAQALAQQKAVTSSPGSKKTEVEKDGKSENTDNKKEDPRTIEAEAVVNQGIDEIIKHNEQEDITHEDKFWIGIGGVRKITHRGDGVIKRVLKTRQSEIDLHHEKHKLTRTHNSKGKKAIPIDEIISLDYYDVINK